MNILIVTPIFLPEARGPALYCYKLCQRIDSKVITFTQAPTNIKNVPIYSVPTNGGPVARQWRLARAVWHEARDCDVIYAQGADVVGLVSVLVGKILKKPTVVKFVGDLPAEIRRDFGRMAPLETVATWLCLHLTDKIIFPAKHLQEAIVRKYLIPKSKTVVIYNAVDD
ncbi:MAG: glycosyltransferase [Patescibacteria group bacterium]|nr:glycosyltransferase [Patescibacteria group bacterium]MCL5431682.1 glycosyltransferase [Patescibacteria group bacterium]